VLVDLVVGTVLPVTTVTGSTPEANLVASTMAGSCEAMIDPAIDPRLIEPPPPPTSVPLGVRLTSALLMPAEV
jgi:hypothetical protein